MPSVYLEDKDLTINFSDDMSDDEMEQVILTDIYGEQSGSDTIEEAITGEPPEEVDKKSLYEDFLKPTAKASLRVPHAMAGSMAMAPVAGVAGALELLPKISDEPIKEGPRRTSKIYKALDMFESGSLNEAKKTFEKIASVPSKLLIKTPEEQKAVETLGGAVEGVFDLVGDVFYEGAGGDRGIGKIPYAEPIIRTIAEAALIFGTPKVVGLVKGSNWYRRLTIKEKGLTDHVINKIKDDPFSEVGLTQEQRVAFRSDRHLLRHLKLGQGLGLMF